MSLSDILSGGKLSNSNTDEWIKCATNNYNLSNELKLPGENELKDAIQEEFDILESIVNKINNE